MVILPVVTKLFHCFITLKNDTIKLLAIKLVILFIILKIDLSILPKNYIILLVAIKFPPCSPLVSNLIMMMSLTIINALKQALRVHLKLQVIMVYCHPNYLVDLIMNLN